MANRIVNLFVKNVAAVEHPANRRKWLIVKSEWSTAFINDLPDSSFALIESGGEKDEDGKTTPRSLRHLPYKDADGKIDVPHLRNALARLNQVDVAESLKGKARKRLLLAARAAQIAEKSEYGSTTFAETMLHRKLSKVYMELGDQYGALMDTLRAICDAGEDSLLDDMKKALEDFGASVSKTMPKLISEMYDDDDDVEKAGKKISSKRMERLKTLYKTLGEIISEGEESMNENEVKKNAPDASTLTKISHAIAAMFGRAAGASDETIEELEKAARAGEEEIPTHIQTAITKSTTETAELRKAQDELKKSNEELRAALAKSDEEAKKLRDENELRKFAEEVSGLTEIGLDPSKDAQLLKSVEEKVGKEAADRLREVFKAQLAQKNASGLLREIGTKTSANTGSSAVERVQGHLKEIVAKNDKMTSEEALSQVWREHPELYEPWRKETQLRIG